MSAFKKRACDSLDKPERTLVTLDRRGVRVIRSIVPGRPLYTSQVGMGAAVIISMLSCALVYQLISIPQTRLLN